MIDGKTYTPFNNYYKWRGGAFDTTLLIPQVASPNGKRPGAIYYNSADSSVYLWSGTQWRRVSGDTTSLSNRINARVKYTDTAAMLNPYKFTADNGLTKDSTVFRLGGSLNQNTSINLNGRNLTIVNSSGNTRFFSNGSLKVGGSSTSDSSWSINASGNSRVEGSLTLTRGAGNASNIHIRGGNGQPNFINFESGGGNIIIGDDLLRLSFVQRGSDNTLIGRSAAANLVGVLNDFTKASGNIVIGRQSAPEFTTNAQGNVIIGNYAAGTTNFPIGDSSFRFLLTGGAPTSVGSERYNLMYGNFRTGQLIINPINGVDNLVINPSVSFGINSTTRGFLQPRMTNTQMNAIPTPASGLQVFNTTDSSNYVYRGTGGVWQKLAFTTDVPTLQQVTTAGNSTTDSIISPKFYVNGAGSDFTISEDGVGSGRLGIKDPNGSYSLLGIGTQLQQYNGTGNVTALIKTITAQNYQITLPDSSGILTQRVTINGTTYNTAANGVVNLGNTDTATVVKAYVTNAEAVTITKGQVVYIFGASGDRASVKLAKNTSDTFSSKTLGIVREDIAAGQAGWVTTQGQVSGINLGAYSPGDILWLDSVPGGFTKVKPVSPLHGVFVGVVERANVGNGLIYVKPQNGQELGELHDTKITSPTNNQVLAYTASTGIWENKTIENILQFDTIPLAAFGAGSGAAGDTLAFSTDAVYGSFYNAANDTLIITQMRAGVLGTSPSITTEVYWNDSLNITAGATILVTGGTSVTGTIGATNVTSFTNNKIPPNNWVFVRTSAVATKPTYFTLTLLGYRKRQ